jgi:muramoyltetrapeptide carboxypeptidase
MIAAAAVQKPKALRAGARFASIAPASPAHAEAIEAGVRELKRLGFVVSSSPTHLPEGYFAGSAVERRNEFLAALQNCDADALIATRGGYGSVYLLDEGLPEELPVAKPLVGISDLTTVQIYLWQQHRWVSFYGPMLAAGLNYGAGEAAGYDLASFQQALTNVRSGWTIPLRGASLADGMAEGVVLGGALTLLESTLSTPWELDTDGAILLLEDRAMRPYQIDRVLMHLKLAGKLSNVRGFVLGDFPDCEASAGSPTVREVVSRILSPLGVPIVFGAPIGHTKQPMLTIPLGVRARLDVTSGTNEGTLEILEPAVTE